MKTQHTQNQSSSTHQRAWITWEVQPRNRSMSRLLEADYFEFNSPKGRFGRYVELTRRTIAVLKDKKYPTVFVQNPSIVLALIAVVFGRIFRKQVVVDAHNAGVFPKEGESVLLKYTIKFITRIASYTIVSNKYLANVIESYGGKSFVMPDPVPECTPTKKGETYDVVFICTWAEDEPYLEVIEALTQLPEITLAITGNYRKFFAEDPCLPDNISLLGFVEEEEYLSLIDSAALLVDLTTRENCLVCGAYEAISVGTPSIISDTIINREVFSKGFIYSKCDAHAIQQAVKRGLSSLEQLSKEIKLANREFKQTEKENAKALNNLLRP